jgi:thiol-disulfide isomerase/thioredoxin
MIKKILFLCTFLVFVMAANSQTIPKWKMKDVVKSYSAKNDTTYVVNFWATFCKPCNEELPDFIRLAEKYKKQKVKLLLVSLDLPSYVAVRLPAFIKKNNYKTNHVWLNETDADIFCPLIDPKWSGAIPATIIVNNKTGYKKFTEDQISPADFEKYLNEAIGGNAMNKYIAPMIDALAIYDNPQDTTHVKREFVTFKSNDSSVYSIAGGKVTTIARIDDFHVVIIIDEKLYYTYSNLGSTTLKNGDIVKPGQLIGFAANEFHGVKPALDLYISDSKGDYIMLTKDDFTNRSDKKLTDHSIDAVNPVRVQMKF